MTTLLLRPIYVLIALFAFVGSAVAQSNDRSESANSDEDLENSYSEIIASRALEMVNEVSNRRRLTTFFENPQSPLYGVQVNHVNVGQGNLTFVYRDLVIVDRLPIVMGRVYDSVFDDGPDFGPGWKLTFSESIVIGDKGGLTYTDANNAKYKFDVRGSRIVPRHVGFHGLTGGRLRDKEITLLGRELTRIFRRKDGVFSLVEVRDRWGNSLTAEYDDGLIGKITTSGGRALSFIRDSTGRILSVSDDVGRIVRYLYNDAGFLKKMILPDNAEWSYAYDGNANLTSIVDPRSMEVAQASYGEDGRVTDARILQNRMSYQFEPHRTLVTNPLNEIASFTQHASGLTQSIVDFSGAETKITFNSDLRPIRFMLNGGILAGFEYDRAGKLAVFDDYSDDQASRFSLKYSAAGRIQSIHIGSEELAFYAYEENGSLIVASDSASDRDYARTSDGRLKRLSIDGSTLDLTSNNRGELTKAKFDNGSYIKIKYDLLDRVESIDFGGVNSAHYEYDDTKFREKAVYRSGVDIAFDYDAVGNLVRFEYEEGGRTPQFDEYRVGRDNQLLAIESTRSPTFNFEYDRWGRVQSASAGPRRFDVEYDRLSRISKATLDDDTVLEASYGPMDADSATAIDNKTFVTTISAKASAGIFGSLDEIVYGRLSTTPYQLIRFSSEMHRFVLTGLQTLAPDAIVLSSLNRRQIPTDGTGYLSGVSEFDKPSNALFIPPEFVAVNCAICTAIIFGHSLEIDGSSSQSIVGVGEPAYIDTDSTVVGCYLQSGSSDVIVHSVGLGDGSTELAFTPGSVGDFSFNHTYSSPGSYNLNSTKFCLCGLFALSQLSSSVTAKCGIQNSAPHTIDGCSIPEQVTQVILTQWGGTRNDPFGGDVGRHSTAFGKTQGTIPRSAIATISALPCNQHDLCYQTCGASRIQCDLALAAAAIGVCSSAYAPEPVLGCPYFNLPNGAATCVEWLNETIACPVVAGLVGTAVVVGGSLAFAQRQQQHCTCGTPPT